MVIAIDGPAAAGKSTAARMLADRLGFVLLDTGALYRVMALHLLRNGVSVDGATIPGDLVESLDVRIEWRNGLMTLFLGDEDVTGVIRSEHIGEAASKFSGLTVVRRALLGLQRSLGERQNVVAEGRDMGTVVFPSAAAKFFVSAHIDERARRRHTELLERGEQVELSVVKREMLERDSRDETRHEAPLVPADDAVHIDTTGLGPEGVIDVLLSYVEDMIPELSRSHIGAT
jgi:cytidylate kinase